MYFTRLAVAAVCLATVSAQFGNLFEQLLGHQRQQQQQHREPEHDSEWFEQTYEAKQCSGYLCSDTLECVSSPVDCPCPFSASQMKCMMPDKKNYVCISKPASEDGSTYEGMRDCDFVVSAWKGLV